MIPSLRDGLPNALPEAMACEKAAGASSVGGGMLEAIQPGGSGLLVAPGDNQALAGAVEALLADRSLRERLGAAARACVLDRFTPQMELDGNRPSTDSWV